MNIILNHRRSGLGFAAVFDLDGTLSDDSMRVNIALQARLAIAPEVRDKLWEQYHAQCLHDNPHQEVLRLMHFYKSKGFDIWVVTARPDVLKNHTMQWLQHHVGFLPNLLAMRPKGNKDKARDLKASFLSSCIGKECAGYEIIIDNSPEVIAECHRIGPTLLFKPHDKL